MYGLIVSIPALKAAGFSVATHFVKGYHDHSDDWHPDEWVAHVVLDNVRWTFRDQKPLSMKSDLRLYVGYLLSTDAPLWEALIDALQELGVQHVYDTQLLEQERANLRAQLAWREGPARV